MKIKILLVLFFAFGLFLTVQDTAYAGVIPTIRGKVLTETQRPIVGVWVAMTSSGCPECVTCLQKKAVRYAQTDTNGEFVFPPVYTPNFSQPGGTCESNPDIGRMIDTDLDGTLDSEMIPKTASTCRDTENGQSWPVCTYEFGCWGSTYTFSVVKPFNWIGDFDEITGVSFNNATVDFTIYPGEIIYHPPTSTPTVSPTPVDTTLSQEPPFPSCLTSTVLQFGSEEICRINQGECKSEANYTFNSIGGKGTLKIYTGMGHLWDEGCNQGANNDPNRSGSKGSCDQVSQNYEAVRLDLNGIEIGRTTDIGTDQNSYWEFPLELRDGQNEITISHLIKDQQLSNTAESVFVKGSICESAEDSPPISSSSCTITLPELSSKISVGDSIRIIPQISQNNGSVDEVTFEINQPFASVCASNLLKCPQSVQTYKDTTVSYSSLLTAHLAGNFSVKVTGKMIDEGISCVSDSINMQAVNNNGWWQVRSGDVFSNRRVQSNVPDLCVGCESYFMSSDGKSDPGILFTGDAFYGGELSQEKWLVEGESYVSPDAILYDNFANKIDVPVNIYTSTITEGTLRDGGFQKNGYSYLYYDGSSGDLTISGDVNLSDRKVVLFVENSNVIIDGNINLTDGRGFLFIATNKSIIISDNVGGASNTSANVEGILFAEDSINTGEGREDEQLNIRGMLVSKDIFLSRKSDLNAPNEVITFAPDQLLLFPDELSLPFLVWKEVQP